MGFPSAADTFQERQGLGGSRRVFLKRNGLRRAHAHRRLRTVCSIFFWHGLARQIFFGKAWRGNNTHTVPLQLWRFQVVSRDVRRQSAAASASTSVAPVLHSSTSGTPAMAWREKLQQACAASYLDKYFPRACRIAEELGVALSSEITQVGEEIARRADMKQLERGRFLAQLRG